MGTLYRDRSDVDSMKKSDKREPKKTETQLMAEKFVRVWNTSDSCQDVADEMGSTRARVKSLANGLRDNGVPMKKFRTRSDYNYEILVRIAEETLKETK